MTLTVLKRVFVAVRVKIGAAAARQVACRGRGALCREWLKVDRVAELFELADEPFGALLAGASVEVVGTEFLVGDVLVEDVVGGDEDRVAQGAGCFAGAAASAEACVLGAEVAALGARGGLGGFGQRRL